jgi:large subunit ribosomal protein LP2
MKYIAAYMLAQLGGDSSPSKAKISAIISSAGITPDEPRIDALLSKIAGRNLADILAEGGSKLALVGGGAGAVGGGAAPASAESAPVVAVAEQKQEEEAVVELAGGFDDLFG